MTTERTWPATNGRGRRPALTRRTLMAAVGFLLIAGFFLTTEHRAHLFGALPFLLLLLCPLLHVFMHGGHGSHGDGHGDGHGDHGDRSMPDGATGAGAAHADQRARGESTP